VATSDRTGRSTDVAVMLRVKGSVRQLQLDSRVTLLDALREHLDLIGTKKGCDQGRAVRARFWSTASACCRASPAALTEAASFVEIWRQLDGPAQITAFS
jgi:hypothetical protein